MAMRERNSICDACVIEFPAMHQAEKNVCKEAFKAAKGPRGFLT